MYKHSVQLNTRKTNYPVDKWAEDLNSPFSKDLQLANKYVKTCSALFSIREMQTKNYNRYNFTPVKMAIIKKSINSKC